jgi:SAM-dependent methyltransferase
MDQLRRLHNESKRKMIHKWVRPGSYVLDCGCGRGGDLHKWKSAKIDRVVGVDPDQESLQEAQSRALSCNSKMIFVHGDIGTAVPWGPFDVVCYNFSVHYIFESPILFQNSIEAIGQCLRPGGLFIGITPEKTLIKSILNLESKFEDILGNKVEMSRDEKTLLVRVADGPFYAEGPRAEPVLDGQTFVNAVVDQGFKLIAWEPMLEAPNGLVSDMYAKFVFTKIR